MGSKQISPILLVAALVVVVAVLGYFGVRSMEPATPPANSYTPGVPPWLDKKHPSMAPGVHAVGTSAPARNG